MKREMRNLISTWPQPQPHKGAFNRLTFMSQRMSQVWPNCRFSSLAIHYAITTLIGLVLSKYQLQPSTLTRSQSSSWRLVLQPEVTEDLQIMKRTHRLGLSWIRLVKRSILLTYPCISCEAYNPVSFILNHANQRKSEQSQLFDLEKSNPEAISRFLT